MVGLDVLPGHFVLNAALATLQASGDKLYFAVLYFAGAASPHFLVLQLEFRPHAGVVIVEVLVVANGQAEVGFAGEGFLLSSLQLKTRAGPS